MENKERKEDEWNKNKNRMVFVVYAVYILQYTLNIIKLYFMFSVY